MMTYLTSFLGRRNFDVVRTSKASRSVGYVGMSIYYSEIVIPRILGYYFCLRTTLAWELAQLQVRIASRIFVVFCREVPCMQFAMIGSWNMKQLWCFWIDFAFMVHTWYTWLYLGSLKSCAPTGGALHLWDAELLVYKLHEMVNRIAPIFVHSNSQKELEPMITMWTIILKFQYSCIRA